MDCIDMYVFCEFSIEIVDSPMPKNLKKEINRNLILDSELYRKKTSNNIERFYIKEINTDEIKLNYRGLK